MGVKFIPKIERGKTRRPFVHRVLNEDEKRFIWDKEDGDLPTKDNILKRLKKDGVYLGKNPKRTFGYYQEFGLLYKPMGLKVKKPYFPGFTHLLIKSIRKAKDAGHSLSDILFGIEVSKGGKCDPNFRGVVAHQTGRERNFTCSYSELGGVWGVPHFYTISPGNDGVKIFKVESKTPANFFTLIKDLNISEVNHLSLEEFSEIVGLVAIDMIKLSSGLVRQDEIIDAVIPETKPPGLFVKYDGLSFMEEEKF